MKILLLFLSFFVVISKSLSAKVFFTKPKMDSILVLLDDAIKHKNDYTQKKEDRLRYLDNQIRLSNTNDEKFDRLGNLFNEVKSFQMDSALVIANQRISLSKELHSTDKINLAQLNLAEVMIVTGMYKEALDILDKMDTNKFKTKEESRVIYHLYHTLYILMGQYSVVDEQRNEYFEKVNLYKDSILSILSPNTVEYKLVNISKLISESKYDEALEVGVQVLESETDEHILAMLAHNLSDVYKAKHDTLNMKYLLSVSALNDIKSGVKEYMSLPELAGILFEENDIERSYIYIKCSLEDAIFCKARLRTIQLSQAIPLINASYEALTKQENRRLLTATCLSMFLVVLLIVFSIYIYKKLKELSSIRRSLKNINKKLYDANNDLNRTNNELNESNTVKEEYIGYVFSLCSLYIDKLDNFRKKVNRQIKTGMVDELYNQTKSSTLVNDELKEFYHSFDTIFLNLFPDFIEDFNSLMQVNEKIYPKDGDLLSPELRIYALVRLGISDSSKIATLLHYSTQTVYNYRLKVRNKSIVEKSKFVEFVQSLGKASN